MDVKYTIVVLHPFPQFCLLFILSFLLPGVELSLQKWAPSREEEMKLWDFVSRAAFQPGASNPRHKITSGMNEGLKDVTREFMEIVNRYDILYTLYIIHF